MPEFDGKHVVFGEVLEGFEHIEGLGNLHGVNEETGEVQVGDTRILDAEEYFDAEFPDHRHELDQPTKLVDAYHTHLPDHQSSDHKGDEVDHEEWERLHAKEMEEAKAKKEAEILQN